MKSVAQNTTAAMVPRRRGVPTARRNGGDARSRASASSPRRLSAPTQIGGERQSCFIFLLSPFSPFRYSSVVHTQTTTTLTHTSLDLPHHPWATSATAGQINSIVPTVLRTRSFSPTHTCCYVPVRSHNAPHTSQSLRPSRRELTTLQGSPKIQIPKFRKERIF